MKSLLRRLFLLSCIFWAPPILRAQQTLNDQEKVPKIEPDRRDFTTGTGVVLQGHLQIEGGATVMRRGNEHEYSFGEVLVRLPVSQRAELRFGMPSYLVQHQGGLGSRQAGADDSMFEVRFLLSKKEKSKVGLQIGSMLPTGSRRVAERRYQPQAILAGTFTLSKRATIVVNAAVRRASEEQQQFTQGFTASSFRYDVSDKVNAFAEIYAFNKQEAGGSSQKFAAVGAVYFLNPRTALDARGGLGLGNKVGGPDYLYSVGLSRLF